MKAVPKDKLPALLEELSKEGALYVPSQAGDMSRFVPWKSDVKLDLEHNTTMSPKELLFPQTEVIYNYKFGEENTVEPPSPGSDKIILFGVRPCDVQAIRCLDEVFLTRPMLIATTRKKDRLIIISLDALLLRTPALQRYGCQSSGGRRRRYSYFRPDGEYGLKKRQIRERK